MTLPMKAPLMKWRRNDNRKFKARWAVRYLSRSMSGTAMLRQVIPDQPAFHREPYHVPAAQRSLTAVRKQD